MLYVLGLRVAPETKPNRNLANFVHSLNSKSFSTFPPIGNNVAHFHLEMIFVLFPFHKV